MTHDMHIRYVFLQDKNCLLYSHAGIVTQKLLYEP